MKQKFLLTTVAFCALLWSTAKAAETEPNNTKAQANTLTLNGGNSGAIGASGDEDWWSVTTNADGKLDVTITISNGLNMWCQIYDNNGTTVLNSGYTAGATTVSKDGLAAGTYYLRVYPYYAGQLPAYTISNTLTVPSQANDVEPNNTKNQAKVLPLNNNRTGHINYYYNNIKDTFDWYKVTTNADGRLRLTMTSANGQNVWAYLYDNDGTTLLASGYTSGSAVVVNKDGLAAGIYYIRVNTYYNSEWAPYTLADSLFVPAQPNDTEPNGTKAQALTLPLNGSVTGHSNYYYNNAKDTADWYTVTTNADGRLRLTMTSANGQNVWAYLYDNDGTTLLASGYTPGSAVVVNKDGLAAGTYYIRVKTYYNSEWAPYTLADSLFVPAQANDTEPNDTKAQALNLPVNGSKTGHVNYYYNLLKDGQDWYKITTTQDGMISLNIQSHNGQNVWAYLYDNDGTTQLNAQYTTTSTTINTDGLQAGTYYVRINTYYTSEFAPYTISNTLTPYTFANDTEPNNYYSQAKTIPSNGTVTGHVNFFYNNTKDAQDRWKINYTGTSGTMTLLFNQEAQKKTGGVAPTYVQVYKDTAAAPVFSNYYYATSGNINLTALTQGYYYIRIVTYYTADFCAYSLNNTFTQSTKAKITLVSADTSATCDSTNSLTLKCTKSRAPYTVQLYRYNKPYGSPRIVNNSQNFVFSNLPKGNYYARAFGDGATGNAFGRFPNTELMPEPVNPRTTAIQSAQARLNWNALSCANYFSIQYRKTSDTGWTTTNTNGNTTFLVIKNLSASTSYLWRVAAADSSNGVTGLSAYTDSISFTTVASFASSINNGDASDINASGKQLAGIYPNPAKTQFTIQYNPSKTTGTVSLWLKNMNGLVVWNKNNIAATAAKGTIVDVSTLPAGIYMLHITDHSNNTVAVNKVVVSR